MYLPGSGEEDAYPEVQAAKAEDRRLQKFSAGRGLAPSPSLPHDAIVRRRANSGTKS